MGKTTIKKGATVNVKTKSGASYSYKFITLAQIHEWLDDNGLSYEATIKRVDDRDYMFIAKIDKDGNKDEPLQGASIPAFTTDKANSASEIMQDYGSVLAMARRYSLMMVYGLAPADDEQPPKPKQDNAKPESGRYGAPAGHIDFNEVEFKLSQIDNVSQVDAFFEQLKTGDMSWRQKAALEGIFKKRKEQIKAQQ